MTQKAVDSLMSSEFKVGANISATAGPVGAGAGANPGSDFLVYSRSKGLFGGVDVSSAVFKPSDGLQQGVLRQTGDADRHHRQGHGPQHQADAVLLCKVEKLYAQLAPRT